jgi:hypothetical protein
LKDSLSKSSEAVTSPHEVMNLSVKQNNSADPKASEPQISAA